MCLKAILKGTKTPLLSVILMSLFRCSRLEVFCFSEEFLKIHMKTLAMKLFFSKPPDLDLQIYGKGLHYRCFHVIIAMVFREAVYRSPSGECFCDTFLDTSKVSIKVLIKPLEILGRNIYLDYFCCQ